ncbi:MAG TPA: hypothetical protein VHN37_10380, partial [Actinomycetota bacterium]|nr:hypothetical protein [Actinomycetota bacterium]
MCLRKGIALAAVPFFVAACGGGDPAAEATPCPRAPAVQPPDDIPGVLDQTHRGDVVDAGRRRGFSAVSVVTKETVVELYPQLARGLLDGGHEIDAGDNEGFEAEIFF